MNREDIAMAEATIREKASKIAYERSEKIDDSQISSFMYRLVKEYIVLGARMMEEELLKIKNK